MSKNINESKLIGGKRKNGHKLNCHCHICENMKNKAKRGGYEEEIEKEQEKMMGGSKKKNGHRKDCKCPICKNMNNSRKRGKHSGTRKSKKLRGGDGEEEEEVEEEVVEEEDDEEPEDDKKGGRKKRGNGHKSNCTCPICKNMRKSKKGGDIENQLPDEEEGGIAATPGTDLSTSTQEQSSSGTEVPASEDEYDELVAAEEGRADKVGGTRRKRRRTKKARKTRRHRRHRR
jgi:hypothetical protein